MLLDLTIFSPIFPVTYPIPAPNTALPTVSKASFVTLSAVNSVVPSAISHIPSIRVEDAALAAPAAAILPVAPPTAPPIAPDTAEVTYFFSDGFSPVTISVTTCDTMPPIHPIAAPTAIVIHIPLLS